MVTVVFFSLRSIGGFSDFSRVVYILVVDCVAMFVLVLFYRWWFHFFVKYFHPNLGNDPI